MRIQHVKQKMTMQIPLFSQPVHAGFPSPADDFIEKTIDFNEVIIKHPNATFCVRVKGDSMIDAGYFPGDLLVVDKAKTAVHGSLVIAILDGEFIFKKLYKQSRGVYLLPANAKYKAIQITEETDFQIWGVVTCSIHYPCNND